MQFEPFTGWFCVLRYNFPSCRPCIEPNPLPARSSISAVSSQLASLVHFACFGRTAIPAKFRTCQSKLRSLIPFHVVLTRISIGIALILM